MSAREQSRPKGLPLGSAETGQVWAIIPARGGSKGVWRKNIQPVGGRPLIWWTIQAALACRVLARVVVSTEDEEIAVFSREHGAEVPFLRPAELARDETPAVEAVVHAVEWFLAQEDSSPDWVLCLQPTSPLRTARDIKEAVLLAVKNKADGVVSVTLVEDQAPWFKRVDEKGRLSAYLPSDQAALRRQDLDRAYRPNGAIYLARWSLLSKRRTWYSKRTYAYVMPRERSLDIDTAWDLYLADLVLRDGLDRRN